MSAASHSESLESWFAVWHPLYRPKLLQLGVYAVSTGIIVYLEAVALREFSNAFALSDKLLASDHVLRVFVAAAKSTAVRLPLFILATFAVLRVGRVALEVAGRISGATLSQRARADLEATILDHLLRKDDAFFASRPPAEILNRLSSDIGRVVDRRNLRHQQRQAMLLIAGNIYFFLREDWKLALAGILTCAAGAWTMQRLTQPVKEMDKAYLGHDDRVKAMFEDFLRASAEAQVADLRAPIRARFTVAQDARKTLFLSYSWLREKLTMVSSASYLLAFVALCAIPIYFMEAEAPNLQIALIPVVLKVLPELFTNASQLVMQRLNLQLSDTSEKRLLEYDSGAIDASPSDTPVDLAARVPLAVDDATFRYRTAEGGQQGGIVGITTTFPAQRWTAIVGQAGSGKSTLLQLIVGRTKAERGTVAYGDARYDKLSPAERARFLTLMPQSLAILDATIAENLSFGRTTEIDADDLALIERTGLAAICQLKALTMHPAGDLDLGKNIAPLRATIRERLAAEGFVVTPFEKGGRDPEDTVIERLARARADRMRLIGKLFAPDARRDLDELLATPLGRALAERAPKILEDTRALLGLPSYAAYAKLAPNAIDEAVWQKRVAVIGHHAAKTRTKAELRDMLLVALTAKVHEIGQLPAGDPVPFRAVLAGVSVPLAAEELHPHLTWRDNLVFGRADAPNARAEGRIDRIILDTLAAEGHADDMVRVGLAFQVGRGGTRLSGGQRQIIALTRALLRRTPVIVLDEPTSALDPSSRARVAALLKDWAAERIVITVSHDPDLVRCAQEVRVLEAGRLAAAGTFAELEADATPGGAAFRHILRL